MVYESGDFACGLSCFGGLVSTEPFDLVVVFDPIGDDQVSPDNLHFGPAAPVPLDPIEDCNGNGFVDLCDTIWGTSFDCNENLIPDECEDPLPCAADVAEDDCAVDVSDLILVIQHWQWEESGADTNGDGVVDVLDLIQVITTWGPCGP